MNTCGNCAFCLPHPAMQPTAPVGMCYGMPPATMLLPGQAAPVGIMKPGRQEVSMSLTSVRPAVQHADRACSVWQPINRQ